MINGISSNLKLNQKIDKNEDLKFETWKKTIIQRVLVKKNILKL